MREEGDRPTSELLDDVQHAAAAIDEAQRRLVDSVATARAAGISYAAIGRALGVSRQAAWERFSQAVGERASE
jgi:hypothetical protein